MVDLICCIPGSICCCCNQVRDTAKIHELDTKPSKQTEAEGESNVFSKLMTRFKQYNSPVTAFVVDFYSPFLQNYVVKIFVIVICSIWFGFTVWGCTTVEDGLDLDDVLPSGTVEHSFASANVRHFAAYPFSIITKDIDYTDPQVQMALLQMSQEVSNASYVELAGGLTAYWLELAIRYYGAIQQFYDEGYCDQFLETIPEPQQASQPLIEAVIGALRPFFEDFTNLTIMLHTVTGRSNTITNDSTELAEMILTCDQELPSLVEQDLETNFTYIPSEQFYQYIALWVSSMHTIINTMIICV